MGLVRVTKDRGAQATLTGSAVHRLMALVAGDARLTHYRHTVGVIRPTVLDRSAGLVPLGTRALGVGEIVALEAAYDVVDVEGDGLLFEALSAPVWPVRWAYDRATLLPMAMVAAERQLGRVQDALEMISRIGGPDDDEVCVRLSRDPVHFIRWAAIQAAAVMGSTRVRSLLETARTDPHPDVREAAEKALQ